jgi:hypothetical protein
MGGQLTAGGQLYEVLTEKVIISEGTAVRELGCSS